jgi:hypothetical protein
VNDDEKTRTNILALNGIQTHGLSVQAIEAYASDRAATGTGSYPMNTEDFIQGAKAAGA